MSTTSPELLVHSYLAGERGDQTQTAAANELGQLIDNHPKKLLEVVQALAPNLTSEDDERRAKGIWLLSDILSKAHDSSVGRQEVRTLTDFFTSPSSLASNNSAPPALTALRRLSKFPQFGNGDAEQVCNALFEHINMREIAQSTRYLVYSVVDTLVASRRQALKNMGKKFVVEYCSLVSGEKDPRNLKLVFGIDRVILIEFDVAECIEDFFDVTFCYFPITFAPPPDDPYGITSEDLQKSLRACLSANPHFASSGLPLFLEKFQASSKPAKRQTLEAVIDCCPVYGRSAVSKMAQKFWDALSIEVYHSNDAEIEELTLSALKAMLETMYGRDSNDESAKQVEPIVEITEVDGIGTTIINGAVEEISDPARSKAQGASKILCKVIEASSSLGSEATVKVFPILLKALRGDGENIKLSVGSGGVTEARQSVFSILGKLLKAIGCYQQSRKAAADLVLFKDELLSALISGIGPATAELENKSAASSFTQMRISAMGAIAELVKLNSVITDNEARFAMNRLTEIMTIYSDTDHNTQEAVEDIGEEMEAGDAALTEIKNVAVSRPALVVDIALPSLLANVTDPHEDSHANDPAFIEKKYKRALVCLASLCVNPALFEDFVVRITGKLDEIGRKDANTTRVYYARALLLTMSKVIKDLLYDTSKSPGPSTTKTNHVKGKDQVAAVERNAARMVTKMSDIFVLPTTSMSSLRNPSKRVSFDYRLVALAANILGLVARSLDMNAQKRLGSDVMQTFGPSGNLKALMDNHMVDLEERVSFHPIFNSADNSDSIRLLQETSIHVVSEIVSSLRPEALPDSGLGTFVQVILEKAHVWSSTAPPGYRDSQDQKAKAALSMAASVINKRATDKEISALVDEKITEWKKNAEVGDEWCVTSLAWIARSLIVRGDARGYACLDWLLDMLASDDDEAPFIPKLLALIANSEDDLLNRQRHAVTRLLYRQRLFGHILPRVDQRYENTGRRVYVEVLASLVKHAPKESGIEQYMGMLVRETTALGCSEEVVREVLEAVGKDGEWGKVGSEEVVESMLRTCVQAEDERTRGAALRSLRRIAEARVWGASVRTQVCKELKKAVDDPRKSVRREAVDARAAWEA